MMMGEKLEVRRRLAWDEHVFLLASSILVATCLLLLGTYFSNLIMISPLYTYIHTFIIHIACTG